MELDANEEALLRSVALQNARAVLLARERAERDLLQANQNLERINRELAEQHEWFRVTLASIGDAVITTDVYGKVTFLNPVAEAVTGWKLAEAAGQPLETIFRIVNEITRQPAPNPIAKVLREGHIIALANHTALISRSGKEIAIEDSAAPIRAGTGKMIGAVMVFHDVTVRRRAEEAVEKSAERLQLALDAGRLGDWSWDATTDAVTLGTRAAEVFGVPRDTSTTWTELRGRLCEEDRDRVRITVEQALVTRENYDIEYRVQRPSGELVWAAARGRGLYAPDGKAVGMIGVIGDITSRKRSEEARSTLAAVVESSDDAIVSTRLDGTITTWNEGARRMYGFTEAEAIGKPVMIIIPPGREEEEPAILRRLSIGERVDHYETVRRRKDGALVDVSLSVSPIRDGEGRVIGASKIARDITERIRSARELKKAQEELSRHAETLERQVAQRTAHLRESIDSLEAVCYTIAHDLRAPLRAVQGFTKILVDDYAPRFDENGRQMAGRIIAGATRMDALIRDLLQYARLSHIDLPCATMELQRTVEKVREDMASELTMAKGEIDIARLPPVCGNRTIVEQVFGNLISNSLKFVRLGVPPKIRIWSEPVETGIRVYVEDNGIGVDPRYHHRLFGMFQRLHGDEKTYPGTGVGLAIVKKGMERMGGSAGIEPHAGLGARFYVDFPPPSPS
jgi:PAS domain S-box-containing protein